MDTALEQPVVRSETSGRIEESALALFRTHGYAGSSIRAIAQGADIAVATMFHHFSSKEAILHALLERIVDQMQVEIDEALKGQDTPSGRLDAFVHALVIAHCHRSDESFVAESELRSLSEELQVELREKRLRIQRTLRQLIEDGVQSGDFLVTEPRIAAIAILTMCTSVASWYRPTRELQPAELAAIFVSYASSIVGLKRDKNGT